MGHISFKCDGDEINPSEWAAAWSLCSNLKVLHALELDFEEIRAIMGTPKLCLKEINTLFNSYDDDADLIMNIVAEGTKKIETPQSCVPPPASKR